MPDINIGRLRGGFCVYWYDAAGKRQRHQLKTRTRKEAEAEGIDVFRRHSQRDAGSVTVAYIWAEYRKTLAGRPTHKTLGYTGKAVCRHLGEFKPRHIDQDRCKLYAAQREREGVSIGTIHTELGHLRSALRYAAKTRLIDYAPHIWRPSKPTPKERFLTHGEITQLIDATAAPHVRLAIILMLGTAGRVGAILDLEWDRVDFERGVINLRLPDSTTRKGRAVVPMNGMTRAALASAKEAALTDYVIEYGGGRVKNIRKGFHNACARAGLDGVTIHTLRHSAAVHMVSAGVAMEKVSQYLGHSNVQITAHVYARYAPSHMQDAADVLNFTSIKNAGR